MNFSVCINSLSIVNRCNSVNDTQQPIMTELIFSTFFFFRFPFPFLGFSFLLNIRKKWLSTILVNKFTRVILFCIKSIVIVYNISSSSLTSANLWSTQMSQVSCIRYKRSKLSKMNTNLRQTLTLSERSFTIWRLFPFFHFSVPSDSLPNLLSAF